MDEVFADTSFFIALINPSDAHHAVASEWWNRRRFPLLVHDAIFIELGNALSTSFRRRTFYPLREALQVSKNVEIAQLSKELFERGCFLFSKRSDKGWSLTDCISFVLMQD